jgi:hypothetical protein
MATSHMILVDVVSEYETRYPANLWALIQAQISKSVVRELIRKSVTQKARYKPYS